MTRTGFFASGWIDFVETQLTVLELSGSVGDAVSTSVPLGEQVKVIQATLNKARQQKNRLDDEWLKSVDQRINALMSDSLPVTPAKAEERR